MANSANAVMHTVKLLLMSTGVVFIGILLTPHIFNFTPTIWSSLRSWLRPPYLYVIINGIIITIAASSRIHHHYKQPHGDSYSYTEPKAAEISPPSLPGFSFSFASANLESLEINRYDDETKTIVETEAEIAEIRLAEPKDLGSRKAEVVARTRIGPNRKQATPSPQLARQETSEIVSSFFQSQIQKTRFGGANDARQEKTTPSVLAPPPPSPLARQETSEIVSSFFQSQIEKPPAKARFNHHRKPTRSTPQGGKGLGVAKPKKTETLESAWKTITEGRQMPLTRHLKKSETWENEAASSDPLAPSLVKKADTFTDRTNHESVVSAATAKILKKEPTLSQDELNRRVEAFINKVNHEMRLQREQSMQQFMDMISHGPH